MKKLICPRCGNDKKFYREISLPAKLRVDNKGNDLKTIYDVDKSQFDNSFETIYCYECNEIINDEEITKIIKS